MADRQSAQQRRIPDAEYRRVGTDTQDQRKHRDPQ